jgi:hypothetical protein
MLSKSHATTRPSLSNQTPELTPFPDGDFLERPYAL